MATGLKYAVSGSPAMGVQTVADTAIAITWSFRHHRLVVIVPDVAAGALLIIVPATWYTDAGGILMDVYGQGFVAGSKVNFEGSQRITVVADATHLVALISASDVDQAGVYAITVTFGGTPGPAYLTVIERVPQAGRGQLLRPQHDLLGAQRADPSGDTIRAIRGADDALRRNARGSG